MPITSEREKSKQVLLELKAADLFIIPHASQRAIQDELMGKATAEAISNREPVTSR